MLNVYSLPREYRTCNILNDDPLQYTLLSIAVSIRFSHQKQIVQVQNRIASCIDCTKRYETVF